MFVKLKNKSARNELDTHPLNIFNFPIDPSYLLAYDLVILCQVHMQQMIMDQSKRHVTCKTGHYFSQMRNLVGRGRVQFSPGVQLCAKVRVLLTGENQYVLIITAREDMSQYEPSSAPGLWIFAQKGLTFWRAG